MAEILGLTVSDFPFLRMKPANMPWVLWGNLAWGWRDKPHLRDPELRALLGKIEVMANEEFTRAYERLPVEHHTRVNVMMRGGERFSGEAGGEKGDLSETKSDAQITEKFLGLANDFLGAGRAAAILDRLWKLEGLENVAEIPKGLVKR